jgi:hypothetical protein
MFAIRVLPLLPLLLVVTACAPEDKMTAEDYAKPENAAALAKKLESCKLVLPSDPRAASCKEAAAAKWASEVKEIRSIAEAQKAAREGRAPAPSSVTAFDDGGVTVRGKEPEVAAGRAKENRTAER